MAAPDRPPDSNQTGEELQADVVFDPRARRRAEALYAEVQALRTQLADFESRYRVTFEEFQASFVPGDDGAADNDYLEWSRIAEAHRLRRQQWEDAMRLASSPLRLPPEPRPRGSNKREPV